MGVITFSREIDVDQPKQKNYVKATDRESGEIRYSANWITSKRTFYSVYDDRIEIGSWKVPFDEIKDIILYKTKQMFIPVSVLAIQTAEKNYQIGFNPWVDPVKNIPIEVRTETTQLKYSAFSLVIRLIAFGYLIYLAWDKLS